MSLLSDKMSNILDELIGDFFKANRLLDRGMSVLAIDFKIPHVSNFVHQKLAHTYIGDKFADAIGDYKLSRDCNIVYPETPIGDKSYESPLQLFSELYDYNLKLEDSIKDAIDECDEEGDLVTKDMLGDILEDLSEYTAISKNLVDIFESCGTDRFKLTIIDANINNLI